MSILNSFCETEADEPSRGSANFQQKIMRDQKLFQKDAQIKCVRITTHTNSEKT